MRINTRSAGTRLPNSSNYRTKRRQVGHFSGLCEFETGDYAHSLEHIRLGLKLGSGTLEPALTKVLQFHEAILLVKQGLFDQAIPLFLAMAKHGVKDPAFITGIGLAALRRPLLPQEVPAS